MPPFHTGGRVFDFGSPHGSNAKLLHTATLVQRERKPAFGPCVEGVSDRGRDFSTIIRYQCDAKIYRPGRLPAVPAPPRCNQFLKKLFRCSNWVPSLPPAVCHSK